MRLPYLVYLVFVLNGAEKALYNTVFISAKIVDRGIEQP